MMTTHPAHPAPAHAPRTTSSRHHHAHRHEASRHSEPRVRSILLSGSSTSTSKSAYTPGSRNADHQPDSTLAPDHSQSNAPRSTRRTNSHSGASQGNGALVSSEGQIGTSSSGIRVHSEARTSSSSASASIHLEDDLAAALASTPAPERTADFNTPVSNPNPNPVVAAPVPTMPHMRPRMSLELPPHEPIDILYDADYKHALEGTSPKPCIVPGNALHLIDDDPAAPRSQTPPSIIIVADESERARERRGSSTTDIDGSNYGSNYGDGDGDQDGDGECDPETIEGDRRPTRPTGPRVRFRSRVRITSGVHRHRHSTSTAHGGTPTPCSSASDSPSSSISAPLRYQSDEHGTWGPLGRRLSAYAAGGGWPRRAQVQTPQMQVQAQTQVQTQRRVQIEQQPAPARAMVGGRVRGGKARRGYDERTPLIRPDRRRMYTESEDEEDAHGRDDQLNPEERALRAAALRREEEAVFGKWPWRIFNRHWWWWHVEPVLCCCCSDDSDYEEF